MIVLLVYLASQTISANRDEKKITYSQLKKQIEAGNVQEVLFTPNRQQINATLVGGDKIKVNYPSDVSALEVERSSEAENVTYDSKGKGRARGGARSSSRCSRSCSCSASGSS